MDVGFENAGVRILFSNELKTDAAATYRANHPRGIMADGDIRDIMDAFKQFRDVGIVFGGPPCQGFSVAGKMDPNDSRSKLIFTFLDVVELVRPRAFVMENVKGILTKDKISLIRNTTLAHCLKMLGLETKERFIVHTSEIKMVLTDMDVCTKI